MELEKLINVERLNQFKLNLMESTDGSLTVKNEDHAKIDIAAKISEEEGNILELKEDGLFVSPDGALLSTDNSIHIEAVDTEEAKGTDLTLQVSEEEGNAIEIKEDGVFVQGYDIATEQDIMDIFSVTTSEPTDPDSGESTDPEP